MRKRFGILVLVLIVSLCLGILLTGCKDEGSINGKYYEEKSDGTLNESSWIELSKKKWTDDEGETGTFELSGTKITFFQDGEDLFDGTLENGVLTIEFFGTTVYRKEPAQKTDNNNNGGGISDNQNNNNSTEYTVSFNSNGGSSVSPIGKKLNQIIKVPEAPTRSGYIFGGWYLDNNTFVNEYNFNSKITSSFILHAKWLEVISFPDFQRINASDEMDTSGEYILFGEYPQTIKMEEVTIVDAKDDRGYYLGSDGYYYAKVTATLRDSRYTFSTGATFRDGTVYYFKVEPIKWRILSESNGEALILCESIIANKQYYKSTASRTIDGVTVYANNYEHSDIRAWLNDEFYNTAFSALQQKLIQVTNVDNSVYSTGYAENPYACANTSDKIFLPSYRDMVNTSYGFNSSYSAYDTARRIETSDYSRATGASMNSSNGNGYWRLRSPNGSNSNKARYIDDDGAMDDIGGSTIVYYTDYGVVPALTINLYGTDETYNVDLTKNIENAGTVGTKTYRSSVTLSATSNIGYTWLGWYDGETKVSTGSELTYTFTPAENKTFEARWEFTERGNYDTDGYTQVGEYIWFGEYPQSIKANNVTVGTTADSRGYYLGSDGYYYAKVTATPYGSGYAFSTGTTVKSGTVYYFKVEPIKWRILSESNGNALILCESIIANKRYNESYTGTNEDGYYANNYMNSEIRAWLNDEFYNTAFNELQQQLIQATNVDNSAYSTKYDPNEYACANTNDKIFLPSYRDMLNTSYGFGAYDTGRRQTSDYLRATGVYMDRDSRNYGNGDWWLRSPYHYNSYYARGVRYDGYIVDRGVDRTYIGVVPALTIKLS